ncbi:MAG: flagellar motor switch protein FliM [Calditrichaeota bacterium]|nr:MAG: flagellar motor switch protein FliM [Calditrichota bacterium]MBL1204015.1 flagellar motor switch protein FliM [Calditrichota bacterium]NOG43846.1 flagellar motor switch protein FliM [Calditrichota bacterium]
MAKILSQDEIDALLSNVSGEEEELEAEQNQKVSLYDFKHPNLVSKEQMRLLENIHEGVCRNFGVFLSAQLRMIVEMNLLAIDQIMYSEFVMSIAPPSCIYVMKVQNPESSFVLEVNPTLSIFIVERLFGGRGGFVSTVRPISIIEQKIMNRVIDRIGIEINKNWESIAPFNCNINRFESNPEFVQIVPSNEPVVVASMEVKIHGNSTLMNICYPYMMISNIVSTPEVQEKILFGAKEPSEEETDLVKFNLVNTPIHLKSLLGKGKISVDEFINLKNGDVVKLGTRTDQSLPLFANNKHMYNSIVGVHKKRYAVRVLEKIPEEKHYGE